MCREVIAVGHALSGFPVSGSALIVSWLYWQETKPQKLTVCWIQALVMSTAPPGLLLGTPGLGQWRHFDFKYLKQDVLEAWHPGPTYPGGSLWWSKITHPSLGSKNKRGKLGSTVPCEVRPHPPLDGSTHSDKGTCSCLVSEQQSSHCCDSKPRPPVCVTSVQLYRSLSQDFEKVTLERETWVFGKTPRLPQEQLEWRILAKK